MTDNPTDQPAPGDNEKERAAQMRQDYIDRLAHQACANLGLNPADIVPTGQVQLDPVTKQRRAIGAPRWQLLRHKVCETLAILDALALDVSELPESPGEDNSTIQNIISL